LNLNGQSVGAESLALNGAGYNSFGALYNGNMSSSASCAGAISFFSGVSIGGLGNTTLSGTIFSNANAFTKVGAGAVTLTGSQNWGSSSILTVAAGTLKIAPRSASSISTGLLQAFIDTGANLVVDATYSDPLTDASDSSRHAAIVGSVDSNFIIEGGLTTVASILGAGNTTVNSGATLIVSDELHSGIVTVEDGGGFILGTPYSGIAPAPLLAVVVVPEPAAWILLAFGSIVALGLCGKRGAYPFHD
jgi:fibronectin-binding autotransporter adhesin